MALFLSSLPWRDQNYSLSEARISCLPNAFLVVYRTLLFRPIVQRGDDQKTARAGGLRAELAQRRVTTRSEDRVLDGDDGDDDEQFNQGERLIPTPPSVSSLT